MCAQFSQPPPPQTRQTWHLSCSAAFLLPSIKDGYPFVGVACAHGVISLCALLAATRCPPTMESPVATATASTAHPPERWVASAANAFTLLHQWATTAASAAQHTEEVPSPPHGTHTATVCAAEDAATAAAPRVPPLPVCTMPLLAVSEVVGDAMVPVTGGDCACVAADATHPAQQQHNSAAAAAAATGTSATATGTPAPAAAVVGTKRRRAAAACAPKTPKNVPCPHGRQRYVCKECGGAGLCEHGRRRYGCKDCGGAGTCTHGRERRYCKECGGAGICEHGRRRRQCKECGGAGICEHGRERSHCKECGGGSICDHGRRRSACKECRGGSICQHGRRRRCCKDCVGVCAHGRVSPRCRDCRNAAAAAIGRQGGVGSL